MAKSKSSLAFKDLSYGFLNPVTDTNTGNTADRRRSTSINYLQNSIQELYASKAMSGLDTFVGVVIFVGEKQVGLSTEKDAILEEYAKRNPASSLWKSTKDIFTGDKVKLTGVYKVYIPELECRPAPTSFDDPVILTYYDVYLSEGSTGDDPVLGSVVQVKFANINNFAGPKIISVGKTVAFSDITKGQNRAAHEGGPSGPPVGNADGTAGSAHRSSPNGSDKSCTSTNEGTGFTSNVNGSDWQTGKELHQNDWLTDWPENPVIDWLLPIKPSEGWEGDPVRLRASSGFARSSGKYHGALDLSARTGTPLYAVQDGQVVHAPPSLCRGSKPSTAGNMFQYKTIEGYYVLYIHMDMPSKFRRGAQITKGQIVGYVGNTGASQAEHLHWAVGTRRIASGAPGRLNPADFYPPEWIWGNWGNKPSVQLSRRGGQPVHTPRRA